MANAAFAPAKVNLFLHVAAPAADGYHPLCSLMVFADVGDRLSLREATYPPLEVAGPFAAETPVGPDNLVLRAARAVLGEAPPPGLSLEKNLPVASGLGGGSSDAGAAFRLLRQTLRPELDDAGLQALAESLGADGAACLWGRPVLAEGRGERLSAAPSLPVLDAVLVNPCVPVSTAEVYRRLDASGAFSPVTPPATPPTLADARAVAAWLAAQRNDLEAPAIAVAPPVGQVMARLAEQPETLLARVSGSGGTCFALCADPGAAETLAGRLAALEPQWWVRQCRLGGPWPDPA